MLSVEPVTMRINDGEMFVKHHEDDIAPHQPGQPIAKIKSLIDSLSPQQLSVLYYLVGLALAEGEDRGRLIERGARTMDGLFNHA